MSGEPTIPPGSLAILIGVPHYQDPKLLSYDTVGNSVEGMRQLLVESGLCGWREDQVITIPDPKNSGQLMAHLRGLADNVSGVLLLYFVGHGLLSEQGELCLAIADTNHLHPDTTGLEYDKIKRMLNGRTTATTRIAILDCCYSGRVVGLGSVDEQQLADLSETAGAYTLTAADGLASSEGAPNTKFTAFSGELLDLLTRGIPGGQANLTLGAIFPVLQRRLASRGLPRPNQRADDSAAAFVFARNAATFQPASTSRTEVHRLGLRRPSPTTATRAETSSSQRNPTRPGGTTQTGPSPNVNLQADGLTRTAEPLTPNPVEVPSTGTTTTQPSPSARPVAPPPWAATPVHQPIQPPGPARPPRAPRRVMAFYMAAVVVAAGCFIGANFLPIGSGYWTDKSSGVQTAQVTLTFNLFHPLTRAVATGVDGAKVEVAQWLAPFLGLGTAVMLALALLFPVLLRSADPDLKAMGETVYKVCLIWEFFFVFALVVAEIFSFIKMPDGPGLYSRAEVQPGAWMLVAASAIVADAMQRTGKRLGLPWATLARPWRVLRVIGLIRTPR